ncbi:putative peptidyl-tRNA hydrolase PTRHD1 [Centruroides vittatus]|uniref:putative peptidyl-tRNA hydrolase PTRHD1 n=1 Tax=Centruroides vittatus TaxID=120091 RepID=UPI00350F9E51
MAASGDDNVVQYIVVRKDLLKTLKWPLGAVIAQTCHATTAVYHLYKDDPYTIKYTSDLDRMRKVVLEIEDEIALRKLSEELQNDKIDHRIWIEQPENFATCLATKPYPKSIVQHFFKKLKLFK